MIDIINRILKVFDENHIPVEFGIKDRVHHG